MKAIVVSWIVLVTMTLTPARGQGAPPGTPLAHLSSDPTSLDIISSASTKIIMRCRFEELTEFFWFVNDEPFASYSYTDGDMCPCPPTMNKFPADFTIVIDQAYQFLDKLKGLSTLTVLAAGLEGVHSITCGSLEIRSTPISMNFSFSWLETHVLIWRTWFETHKLIWTITAVSIISMSFFLYLYYFTKDNSDLKVDFKKKLGSGAFGSVYEGTYRGSPIAAKYLNFHVRQLTTGGALMQILGGAYKHTEKSTLKDVRTFQDECDRLRELNHDNIVCHIATLNKSSFPILVMELMKCSLRQYLKDRGGRELSLDYQFSLCIDICKGLAYLRQKELVHRDLCADNVLLALPGPDSCPKAKIADFGLYKLLCGDLSTTLSVFTKREAYVAPEALKPPYHYEYSLDMYAFGVLAAQIIRVNFTMYRKVDLTKVLKEIPDSHQMCQFIQLCLSHDRKRRPKASNAAMYLNLARQRI